MSGHVNCQINHLGIDAPTKGAGVLRRRLQRLMTTKAVEDGGVYREDPSLCQIWVDTVWTKMQLDHWLWKSAGIAYVGTFTRKQADT